MARPIRLLVWLGAVAVGACGTTASNSPPETTTAQQPAQAGPTEVAGDARGVIPAGQQLDVRLQERLSSATAKPEQRFEATTVVDLTQDGRVLVPAGSVVRGVITSVDKATRTDRSGSLTLSFDQLTVRGRAVPIRGMATQVFESGGIREEVGTAGAGAGIGGIIGGIIGGVRGALLGAVIGAGGAIAATAGKDIELPACSIVRIRLDSPVNLR